MTSPPHRSSSLGDPVYSYPALTGDGVLVVGSRSGRLVAIG
ncbi:MULTISPECIES: PQQ-binding-like beta-propeller repeat protein [unclassified Pseudonocardia]|nr:MULTISPECIES: PQQ-binding-like beta-propeller repeat protein [unclassified Pseudonocardia]